MKLYILSCFLSSVFAQGVKDSVPSANANITAKFPNGFRIQDSQNRTWKSFNGKLCLVGANTDGIIEVTLKGSQSQNTYDTTQDYMVLQDVTTDNFIRHAGFVMWDLDGDVNYPEYDFAYKFFLQADGSYTIYNDYDGGYYVGYDSVIDRVLIVPPEDPRIQSWTLLGPPFQPPPRVFDDNNYNVSFVYNKGFVIMDSQNRTWKVAGASDPEPGALRLNSGSQTNLTLDRSDNRYSPKESWHSLKDLALGTLVRHAGMVMWSRVTEVANPLYDFAWKFYLQPNGSYRIFNAYYGGHWVGYDSERDQILICAEGDPNIQDWTLVGI